MYQAIRTSLRSQVSQKTIAISHGSISHHLGSRISIKFQRLHLSILILSIVFYLESMKAPHRTCIINSTDQRLRRKSGVKRCMGFTLRATSRSMYSENSIICFERIVRSSPKSREGQSVREPSQANSSAILTRIRHLGYMKPHASSPKKSSLMINRQSLSSRLLLS